MKAFKNQKNKKKKVIRRAAGDYDGDGETDVAVWRNGIYYVLNSSNSAANYQYFGASGDKVVASAFIE